jgi:hypothetical protein
MHLKGLKRSATSAWDDEPPMNKAIRLRMSHDNFAGPTLTLRCLALSLR